MTTGILREICYTQNMTLSGPMPVLSSFFASLQLLVAAVQALGNNNWLKVSDLVPSRTSAQCRER